MKHVDENKLLKKDLRNITKDRDRYKSLAQKQHDEVEVIKSGSEKLGEALRVLTDNTNALIISCAIMFGEDTGKGFRLTIPKFVTADLIKAYELRTRGLTGDGSEAIIDAVFRR